MSDHRERRGHHRRLSGNPRNVRRGRSPASRDDVARGRRPPLASDNDETARLADIIEGVAGELSSFEQLHGFSIDGVDLSTSTLPAKWRERLVRVQNPNTAAPGTEHEFTGWCLDKEDLCVAKLCAYREKDRNFVAALLDAELVDPDVIAARLSTVAPERQSQADAALNWIAARRTT